MSNSVYSYKCPGCGSVLKFSALSQTLTCQHCGREVTIEQETGELQDFDWGDYKASFMQSSEQLEGLKVYQCKSCGATLQTDETTAAMTCPYCSSEVVITDRLDEGLKPNVIIPFKIDRKGLEKAVRNHIKGKHFLPYRFIDRLELSKVTGVYVHYWLYHATMSGSLRVNADEVTHSSDSEYSYTHTSTYEFNTEGSMHFENVSVDASKKMENDLMDSVGNYDFSELVPFNTAYLSGYLAERFDEDPDTCLKRAERRMLNTAMDVLSANTAGSYTNRRVVGHEMYLTDTGVRYGMLPVYLLNLKYENKKYRFAVNGQTGKIIGEVPVSKKRKKLTYTGIFALAGVLAYLVQFLLFVH